MMQNTVINADFQIPVLTGLYSGSKTRAMTSSDDTFIKMLNERIKASSSNRIPRTQKFDAVNTKTGITKTDGREVRTSEKKDSAAVKTSGSETVKAGKTRNTEKAERTETDDNRSRDEVEDEILTLEAMIALLEELMARLEELISAARDSAGNESKAVLAPEAESVSPMELLMALVTGDVGKLKSLVNEASKGMIYDPEINELIEKIRSLIEKLSGDEGKDSILEFTAELDKANGPTYAEVLNELKAKCGQMIEKLMEQVSKLREGLPDYEDSTLGTAISEETVEEPARIEKTHEKEHKQRTDSGEGQKAAEAINKEPLPQVTDRNGIDNTEIFIIPDSRVVSTSAAETRQADQIPAYFSGKPLEQTVTNQVIMKLKLMAGENRQEMEIHLKPESLGKLSLKIVHERGEILARITAENEQVKEILESNMQLLRDALEKNGYSVQSLSVSVGNGHGDNSAREEQVLRGRGMTGSGNSNETSSSIREMSDLRARIEKEYYGHSSRIDLTA